jgi:hypothetical protein
MWLVVLLYNSLEDIAQWSDKDKGIYGAAAAAGVEFGELNRPGLPVCTFVELALPELVDALIPGGSSHWREDNSSGRILTTSINVSIITVNVCSWTTTVRRGTNTERIETKPRSATV